MPISVVSDRDLQFTSRFWRKFHDELGTQLHFSTAYYPRSMFRASGPFNHSRICFELVYLILKGVGVHTSHYKIFHIPIVIMLVFTDPRFRCSVDGGARLLYAGEEGHQVMGSTKVVLKTTELIQQVLDRL